MPNNTGNKNPPWEQVRSKLTRDGYLYRMKLGNPPPTNRGQEARRLSSPSTASLSDRRPRSLHEGEPSKSADTEAGSFHTIAELLEQSHLSDDFWKDPSLDANGAIDFLRRCYAPFAVHRRNKTVPFELPSFLDGGATEDNMFAKAFVVWAADLRDTFGPEPRCSNKVILEQRNNVIRELRSRISSPDSCTSDTVMYTILLLIGTELIHDNVEALGTHLGALRHIIHLRGGTDSPYLSTWVKIPLLQFEDFMNYRHFDRVRRASLDDSPTKLKYPSHPFQPDLCTRLAQQPPGFCELFCTTLISIPVLELVEGMGEWMRNTADSAGKGEEREGGPVNAGGNARALDAFRAFDLLQQDLVWEMERLLILALLAVCIYMDDQVTYSVMEWAQRLHCMALASRRLDPIEEDVWDCMIWVAAVLMAVGGKGSPSWHLGGQIRQVCGTSDELEVILHTSQRYFWDEDLTQRLASAMEA